MALIMDIISNTNRELQEDKYLPLRKQQTLFSQDVFIPYNNSLFNRVKCI